MKIRRVRPFIILTAGVLIALAVITWCFWERPEAPSYSPPKIKLYISKSDNLLSLSLEDYICGTVAAEMPASFEYEALKAQAICARTYALNRLTSGIKYENNADLSDDITCCQAYISDQEFGERHPQGTEEYLKKIRQAVAETKGQVMIYQGEPLDALYSSTCGGRTENGGAKQPYLKSVLCTFCKASPRNITRQTFSSQQISAQLGLPQQDMRVQVTEARRSGRIKQISINGKTMTGEELRSALDLPSTWCSFQTNGNSLIITSRGYGHGIGLCQFGANGMARQGYTYLQILHHYYQNFDLCHLPY